MLIAAAANAAQADQLLNESRNLQETSQTITFAPNYDHESDTYDRGTVVGMVLGFFGYIFCVVFAVVSLCWDSLKTHKQLELGI